MNVNWNRITLSRNGYKPLEFIEKVYKAVGEIPIEWGGDALRIVNLEVHPNICVSTKDEKKLKKRLQNAGLLY